MAGPNLEVFKFGFYMFFPIYMMFKFGDPVWYDTYVQPYKEILWPAYETTNQPPKTGEELHAELARLKAQREARRVARGEQVEGARAGVADGGRVADMVAEMRRRPEVPPTPVLPAATTTDRLV